MQESLLIKLPVIIGDLFLLNLSWIFALTLFPQPAYVAHSLEIFACLRVPASDDVIFTPQRWRTDNGGLTDYVKDNAMHIHTGTMEQIGTSKAFSQILAMSTCSSEFTEARTVLLAVMKPYSLGE